MALMLVIMVMAVAAVMAYAMLANSAAQEQSAANQNAAAQADALAESGVGVAMYYLQNPSRAPSLTPAAGNIPAYWPGANNISFPGATGTANITVAPYNATGSYWTINATGNIAGHGGAVAKATSAIVVVKGTFQANQAMTINQPVILPRKTFITGAPTAIVASGTVTYPGGSKITGNILASGVSGPPGLFRGILFGAPKSNPVPPVAALRDYSTYTYGGVTCHAQAYVGGSVNPTAGNPAGIYIYGGGNLTINGPVTINGTLCVTKGDLLTNGAVTVNSALSGFPALVTSGALSPNSGCSVNLNGLTYLGNGIGPGISGNVIINGALVMNGGFSLLYDGNLHVNYVAALALAPDLTTVGTYLSPQSARIANWNP